METSKATGIILIAAAVLLLNTFFDVDIRLRNIGFNDRNRAEVAAPSSSEAGDSENSVMPPEGVVVPARWNDLGAKMLSVGVIDRKKLEELYSDRGGLSIEERKILEAENNGNLVITPENASFVLNMLWALGLGNKNAILEQGPMTNPAYGGAGNFASTGGWVLAAGEAMNHYSRHPLVVLTPEQQGLVERVSKNIYRPCCDNPTYFPDCNHGMAMLGLLELMASQGVSEEEMYRLALQVNAYWFPEQYLTIAKYLKAKGIPWDKADAKAALGRDFSSASGYREIQSRVTLPERRQDGASCGA